MYRYRVLVVYMPVLLRISGRFGRDRRVVILVKIRPGMHEESSSPPVPVFGNFGYIYGLNVLTYSRLALWRIHNHRTQSDDYHNDCSTLTSAKHYRNNNY